MIYNEIYQKLFLILFIVAIINAYIIKSLLKNNGYEVKWFSSHIRDVKNIFNLANNTKNEKMKKNYLILGYLDIFLDY
ncbi:MAG: hypothetical protein RLZZ175_2610 [Bacteroidota bacterium]|jgi:uncharacterized protein (UPF0333 family)